jgi:hypothetical protein
MRYIDFALPVLIAIGSAVMMANGLFTLTYFEYDRGAPGPGFLPFWISLGLLVLATVIAVQAIQNHRMLRVPHIDWPDRPGWNRILFMIGLLAVSLLVLKWLGFIVTATLYILFSAYVLQMRRLRTLVATAVLAGATIYLVFVTGLNVGLPKGPLGF